MSTASGSPEVKGHLTSARHRYWIHVVLPDLNQLLNLTMWLGAHILQRKVETEGKAGQLYDCEVFLGPPLNLPSQTTVSRPHLQPDACFITCV